MRCEGGRGKGLATSEGEYDGGENVGDAGEENEEQGNGIKEFPFEVAGNVIAAV